MYQFDGETGLPFFHVCELKKKNKFKYFPFGCMFGYAFQGGLVLYRNHLTDLICELVNQFLHVVLSYIVRQNVIDLKPFQNQFLNAKACINQIHQVFQLVDLVLHTEPEISKKKIVWNQFAFC